MDLKPRLKMFYSTRPVIYKLFLEMQIFENLL